MQTLDGETIETLAPARRLQGNAARELPGACRVIEKMDDFRALDPFFRIIEEGLAGSVDGEHFFDMLADDVTFDFIITVPDYPRHIVGRADLIELYRGYGSTFFLDRCYDLRVHRSPSTSSVVLEYS